MISIKPYRYLRGAIFVVLAGLPSLNATAAEPLQRAHAHNDYEHERPLLDALQHGFCSVEADVFVQDGELLVAHNRSDIQSERTLRRLYLEPLRKITAKQNGYVYTKPIQFTLLIDFKSSGESCYPILAQQLREFRELVEPSADKPAPVQVVISGNRPFELVENAPDRLCGLDGRLSDLDSDLSSHVMPLISDNWRNHFRWQGEGAMPSEEKDKLREIVAKCHAKGRRVRFWATPESEALWFELVRADVDHINTDQLNALSHFLQKYR